MTSCLSLRTFSLSLSLFIPFCSKREVGINTNNAHNTFLFILIEFFTDCMLRFAVYSLVVVVDVIPSCWDSYIRLWIHCLSPGILPFVSVSRSIHFIEFHQLYSGDLFLFTSHDFIVWRKCKYFFPTKSEIDNYLSSVLCSHFSWKKYTTVVMFLTKMFLHNEWFMLHFLLLLSDARKRIWNNLWRWKFNSFSLMKSNCSWITKERNFNKNRIQLNSWIL